MPLRSAAGRLEVVSLPLAGVAPAVARLPRRLCRCFRCATIRRLLSMDSWSPPAARLLAAVSAEVDDARVLLAPRAGPGEASRTGMGAPSMTTAYRLTAPQR